MALIPKIYIWSLILEPLLFFVVGHRDITGVVANLSRILQFFVVASMALQMINLRITYKEVSPLRRQYVYYTLYFILTCISGVWGLMSGAYIVGPNYNEGVSGFSAFLNSAWMRPIFEYVISIYFFVYFVVLAQYFMKNERSIDYFFKAFFLMFIVTLVIGFIDYAFSSFGILLVGRHLGDYISVGRRFHGLAGEPRDAFVYLMLGLAFYVVRSYWLSTKQNNWWIFIVIVAALMTESASGLIGLAIFVVILAGAAMLRLNKIAMLSSVIAAIVIPLLIYSLIDFIPRLTAYRDAMLTLWDILESRRPLPFILVGQGENIYPAYNLIVKMRQFDFVSVFIGSGLGSASAITNYFAGTSEISNPHSQFIRVIYESGLIGLLLFIMSFYKPVELAIRHMDKNKRRTLLTLTLLVIGVSLGHRSAAPYIFVGVMISVFRLMTLKNSRTHSS